MLYDLVLHEAREVSHGCWERPPDLKSRFERPDREQRRKVEANRTNGNVRALVDPPMPGVGFKNGGEMNEMASFSASEPYSATDS